CGKSGNIPARKSVLQKTDMSQSPYDIIKDQLVLTARARPTTPNYPAVSEAVMDTFNAVAFGADVEKTDAEAVAKIERALR
ncbi:MAG: hypothetical protein ACHQ1F_01925, partial [Spirochaetia bacterium]